MFGRSVFHTGLKDLGQKFPQLSNLHKNLKPQVSESSVHLNKSWSLNKDFGTIH